jgi:hypothetical protein
VISTIIGAFEAFEQAGIDFELLMALSGGYGPAASWQDGVKAARLAVRAVQTPFISLLSWETTVFAWLWLTARRRVSERAFPETGIFGTELLGEYFAKLVPEWPKGLATAAVTALYKKRGVILFTDEGIVEQTSSGPQLLISLEQMKAAGRSLVGEAARATMGIPGFCTPHRLRTAERDMLVFDGVFSQEGPYLIDPIVDPKMFGYKREEILVFNVSEEGINWLTKVQDFLYWAICRPCYLPPSPPGHRKGITIVSPIVKGFSSVNFWVGEYDKLRALLKGYEATFATLNDTGECSPEQYAKARAIVAEANALHKRTWWMKWLRLKKWRAQKLKELLARHDMYDLT